MTDSEWRKSKDPVAMGAEALASPRATERVVRLYIAAFWMWQANRLPTLAEREEVLSGACFLEPWAEAGTPPPEALDVYTEKGFVFLNPDARIALTDTARAPSGWHIHGKLAVRRAVVLFRELFGLSPSNPVMLDAEWLTSTVVSVARGIYEEQSFDQMPILADALQDAGCENQDVLKHCRAKRQLHVCGCWVLDLLLRKS